MATKLSARALARDEIKAKLQAELVAAKNAVLWNKGNFNSFVQKQTVLKRKVSELHKLIKHLEAL